MKEDNIIKSIKGIKRAEPNPFLFTRIEAKLNNEAQKTSSPDWFSRVAFCLGAVLIIMNVMIITSPSEEPIAAQVDQVDIELPADTELYTSIIQNFNFYDHESD